MHFPTGRSQESWKKSLSPGLWQELYRISLESIVAPERRKINNNVVFKIKCLKTKTHHFLKKLPLV